MICSLGELQALVQKAASGAGMHWGLAEETAKAVRWLMAHNLPGAAALIELLELNDGKSYEEFAPLIQEMPWRARSGVLSPLITGVAISDLATQILADTDLELAETLYPILLTPFIGRAATATATPLKLSWSGVEIICSATGINVLESEKAQLSAARSDGVRVGKAIDLPADIGLTAPRISSVAVDDAVWQRFASLAHRTYVPASEASRQAGAGGGGLTDND